MSERFTSRTVVFLGVCCASCLLRVQAQSGDPVVDAINNVGYVTAAINTTANHTHYALLGIQSDMQAMYMEIANMAYTLSSIQADTMMMGWLVSDIAYRMSYLEMFAMNIDNNVMGIMYDVQSIYGTVNMMHWDMTYYMQTLDQGVGSIHGLIGNIDYAIHCYGGMWDLQREISTRVQLNTDTLQGELWGVQAWLQKIHDLLRDGIDIEWDGSSVVQVNVQNPMPPVNLTPITSGTANNAQGEQLTEDTAALGALNEVDAHLTDAELLQTDVENQYELSKIRAPVLGLSTMYNIGTKLPVIGKKGDWSFNVALPGSGWLPFGSFKIDVDMTSHPYIPICRSLFSVALMLWGFRSAQTIIRSAIA